MTTEYIARCQNCGELTIYSNNRLGKEILCMTCKDQSYKPLYCRKIKKAVLAFFRGLCYYCRKPAQVVDHLIPLSRGGTNEVENLVAACHECNSKKGTKTPQEYSTYLKSIAVEL